MKVLLVLGHGSRTIEAQNIFNRLVDLIREKSDFEIVKGCSMENSTPTFEEAVEELVESGHHHIVLAPLFIYRGVHIQEDIPNTILELKKKYPNLEFHMTDVIGADDRIAEIMIDRIRDSF
ncbi:hypothetical protein BHU72_02870 [Desulfuribacillus stibiiarsenatis]|uniref:Cobalamin biosynthesis protein CbiX n=1 Tax=Desulfuribacillus stibiiarsenatis TaxID=1390249 RepID=A0A1E5L6G9_9FIRM|nr:CbiX/SirB N-terminal domain-containing protein [Desulfuribacillus stibiiarsenatis]OEH85740.1 hypothetical protein BHU72_02870 [Desulfuribacillus stibiiarsenatis]